MWDRIYSFNRKQVMDGPDAILIHYAEIALKGRSRPHFERLLRKRIDQAVEGLGVGPTRWEIGRMTLDLRGVHVDSVIDRLGKVPGIAWFASMHRLSKNMEVFKRAAVDLSRGDIGSFRVSVKRSDRRFPVTSMEIARQMGASIVEASGRKVDLTGYDHNYCLEISEKGAYFFSKRFPGLGGLPTGVNGHVVVFLSGGVDSTVAAVRMICRGATVHALHFFNASMNEDRVPDRADRLAAALSRFQGRLTLYKVDFEPAQKVVVEAVPADHRTIVYRRLMLRTGERLLRENGWNALVTGDIVGQVAAQTLNNLGAMMAAVNVPVLTPLSGDRREDLLKTVQALGTHELSSLPHDDCVNYMAVGNPGLHTSPEEYQAFETFDVDALVSAALEGMDTISFRSGEKV